jgi:hypothetical protein
MLVTTVVVAAGCEPNEPAEPAPSGTAGTAAAEANIDRCANDDGGLSDASFVLATQPLPGARVASGFTVEGCARTFEGTVQWRLLARDGSTLAEGITQGGTAEGPAPFRFQVDYTLPERQVGHLEVLAPRVTDEGFPPGRTVMPLVLSP